MTWARRALTGGDAAVARRRRAGSVRQVSDIRPSPSSAYPSPYLYPRRARSTTLSYSPFQPRDTSSTGQPPQAICRQPWRRQCPSASVHSTHYILAATHPRRPSSLAPPGKAALNGHVDVGGALQRSQSMDFHTPEGTVHVSKPFRSRQTKKLRAMITFTPRKSHFDTTNERSGTNEFRVRPPGISLRALLIMIVACRGSSPCSGYLCLSSW